MGLDNRRAGGQAETEPIRLRRGQWRKQARGERRIDANAVVRHADLDLHRLRPVVCGDADPAIAAAGLHDRIQRVLHEV